MNVQQKYTCTVFSTRFFTDIFHAMYLQLWSVIDSNQCVHCGDTDTLGHYFAECQVVKVFWKSLKTWFLRTFQFVINFTTLDILLGIPNYDKNNDITNFIILFAKNYIILVRKIVYQ